MTSFKSSSLKLVVFFFIALSVVAIGLLVYNQTLTEQLSLSTEKTLSEISIQQKFNFDLEVRSEFSALENLASAISYFPNNVDNIVTMLSQTISNTNFDNMAICGLDGKGVLDNGQMVDLSHREYFPKVLAGETVLSNPIPTTTRNAFIISLATPIKANGQVTGVLVGSYTKNRLNQMLLPSFDGKGYVFIINEQGDIITNSYNNYTLTYEENLFSSWAKASFLKGGSYEEIVQKIKRGDSGRVVYSLEEGVRLADYRPLDINGWSIIVVVPMDIIAANANAITQNAAWLALLISLGFVLFVLYILWQQRKANLAKALYTSELEKTAYFDELTGLPNLPKFKLDAKKILADHPETNFVVAKFDIFNFKIINEMYDFETGDQIILAVSRLAQQVREQSGVSLGIFARINADQFILLDPMSTHPGEVSTMRMQRFEHMFQEEMQPLLGGHKIDFRYGTYLLEPGEKDISSAIEKANLAHHTAKNQKKKICNYDDSFKENVLRETEMENRLDIALSSRAFQVYLQPKYALSDETIVGAEALVRWMDEAGHLISPGEFIPLFERTGSIVKLDLYMFERVCEIVRGWIDTQKPLVPISVNFSRLHLSNPNFVKELERITIRHQVPRQYIEIELTESTIFDNEETLETLLEQLHSVGFTLSMDDFGTGYSSLGLLKNLPVDVIKIDRSFFVNSKYKTRAQSVIESVMQMAKKLSVDTVAEGVETKDQIDFLRRVGCDIVQGYYYAKPRPAEQFFSPDQAYTAKKEEEDPFDLSQLGDVSLGRQTLGVEMPVSVYRLFQFTMREVLTKRYGEGEMIQSFRISGKLAGQAFAQANLNLALPFDQFVEHLKENLSAAKIGLLELEQIDPVNQTYTFTVRDDLDCSGVPHLGNTLCQYDEGFIAGILYAYTHRDYAVVEIDCWGTGADVCRFEVKPL